MMFAALELNDLSLLIQTEDGALHAEPGFARLTRDGIETGEAARALAWREPQHVYNQYWSQLSQAPLPNRHRHARHHADIAYAQLRRLWQEAGAPEGLILLVPGSFTREQLSLLLGMAEALPARVRAIIDSGLAACTEVDADTLHVDLQLHDAVLTVCRPQGGSIRIVEQEIFPGFGMTQLQNAIARHISELLIEGYRFDPLHSSDTEQAIFDQLPQWLTRLRWEGTVSAKLPSDRGDLPCILDRDTLKTLVAARLATVRAFLEKWPSANLLLAHAAGPLTGLVDEFANADVAGQTAATQRCLNHQADILDQVDDLYRVRALYRSQSDTAGRPPEAVNGERLATHLLCGDLAMPLGKPVSIRLVDGAPQLTSGLDDGAALTLVIRNRALETLHRSAEVSLPPSCRPGESIRIGSHELRLIRVRTE